MPGAANKVPYAGFLAASATVLYTFYGARGAWARLAFASFCNTDSVARTITLAVVPAGETTTAAQWRLLDELSLDSKESLWLVDEGEEGVVLKEGDQIVALASAANVVAARLCVEEIQQ